MKSIALPSLALLACPAAQGVSAQPAAPEVQQVLQLSASARKEVAQDWLSVVVRTQQNGSDPVALQTQLKTTL